MKRCSTAQLRDKEIINLCDGMRLGFATDFEINVCDARIVALIVPSCGGFLGLAKGEELVIPWDKIECIGEDTILVKINAQELCHGCADREKRRKRKFPW